MRKLWAEFIRWHFIFSSIVWSVEVLFDDDSIEVNDEQI